MSLWDACGFVFAGVVAIKCERIVEFPFIVATSNHVKS